MNPDTKKLILSCVNVFLKDEAVSSLAALSNPSKLSKFLGKINKKDFPPNIPAITSSAKEIFQDHFVSTDIVNFDAVFSQNEKELGKLILLLVYVSLIDVPETRSLFLNEKSMLHSNEIKFKHMIERIENRGSGLSKQFLDVLLEENFSSQMDSDTSFQSPVREKQIASPSTSSPKSSQSPLVTYLNSPSFVLKRNLADKVKETRFLNSQLQTLDTENQELNTKNQSLTKNNVALERSLNSLRMKYDDLKRHCDTIEDQYKASTSSDQHSIVSLRKELKDTASDKTALSDELKKSVDENLNYEKEIVSLKAEVNSLKSQRGKLKEEICKLSQALAENDTLIQVQSSEIKDFKQTLQELQRHLSEEKQSRRGLDSSFGGSAAQWTPKGPNFSQGEDMATAVVDKLYEESQREVSNLKAKIKEYESNLSSKEKENKSLSSESEERKKKLDLVTKEMAALRDKIKNASKDREDLERSQASLKNKMNDQAKKFEEEKLKLIQSVDDRKRTIEESDRKLNQLNGELKAAKEAKSAADSSISSLKSQMKKMNEEFDSERTKMSGSSSQMSQRLAASEKELAQVKEMLKKKSDTLSATELAKANIDKELRTIKASFESERQKFNEQLIEGNRKTSDSAKRIAELNQELAQLKELKSRVEATVLQLRNEAKKTQDNFNQERVAMANNVNELRQKLSAYEMELSQLKDMLKKKSDALSATELAKANLDKEFRTSAASFESERQRLNQLMNEGSRKMAENAKRIAELSQELVQLKELKSRVEATVLQLRNEAKKTHEDFNQERKAMTNNINNITLKCNASQTELVQTKETLKVKLEALSASELLSANLDKELKNTVAAFDVERRKLNKILDDGNKKLENYVIKMAELNDELRKVKESKTAADAQINSLKNEIKRISEEYRAEKQKLNDHCNELREKYTADEDLLSHLQDCLQQKFGGLGSPASSVDRERKSFNVSFESPQKPKDEGTENEVAHLKEMLKKKSAEMDSLKASWEKELKAANVLFEAESLKLTRKVEKSATEISRLKEELKIQKEKTQNTINNSKQMKKSFEEKLKEIGSLVDKEKETEVLMEKYEISKQKLKEVQDKFVQSEKICKKLKEEVDSYKKQSTDEKKIAPLLDRIRKLENERQPLKDKLTQLENLRKKDAATIRSLEAQLKMADSSIREMRRQSSRQSLAGSLLELPPPRKVSSVSSDIGDTRSRPLSRRGGRGGATSPSPAPSASSTPSQKRSIATVNEEDQSGSGVASSRRSARSLTSNSLAESPRKRVKKEPAVQFFVSLSPEKEKTSAPSTSPSPTRQRSTRRGVVSPGPVVAQKRERKGKASPAPSPPVKKKSDSALSVKEDLDDSRTPLMISQRTTRRGGAPSPTVSPKSPPKRKAKDKVSPVQKKKDSVSSTNEDTDDSRTPLLSSQRSTRRGGVPSPAVSPKKETKNKATPSKTVAKQKRSTSSVDDSLNDSTTPFLSQRSTRRKTYSPVNLRKVLPKKTSKTPSKPSNVDISTDDEMDSSKTELIPDKTNRKTLATSLVSLKGGLIEAGKSVKNQEFLKPMLKSYSRLSVPDTSPLDATFSRPTRTASAASKSPGTNTAPKSAKAAVVFKSPRMIKSASSVSIAVPSKNEQSAPKLPRRSASTVQASTKPESRSSRSGPGSPPSRRAKPTVAAAVTSPSKRTKSLRSVPREMQSLFRCENEEEDEFNHKYLADLKVGKCQVDSGPDWRRVSELQRRNSLYPPHMRSAYPAEMQFQPSAAFTDDQLREGSAVADSQVMELTAAADQLDLSSPSDSAGRKRSLSDTRSQTSRSSLASITSRKSKRLSTSYSRPGPPTPGRRGSGKMSLTGSLDKSSVSQSSNSSDKKWNYDMNVKTSTPSRWTRSGKGGSAAGSPSVSGLRSGKGVSPAVRRMKTPASVKRLISRAKSPWSKVANESTDETKTPTRRSSGASSGSKLKLFRKAFGGGKTYNVLSATQRVQETRQKEKRDSVGAGRILNQSTLERRTRHKTYLS